MATRMQPRSIRTSKLGVRRDLLQEPVVHHNLKDPPILRRSTRRKQSVKRTIAQFVQNREPSSRLQTLLRRRKLRVVLLEGLWDSDSDASVDDNHRKHSQPIQHAAPPPTVPTVKQCTVPVTDGSMRKRGPAEIKNVREKKITDEFQVLLAASRRSLERAARLDMAIQKLTADLRRRGARGPVLSSASVTQARS